MKIFGINILTPRELKAMREAVEAAMLIKVQEQQAQEVDDPRMLESAKFAREFNKGTSSEMLTTIDTNSKEAERNSKIALYISIPHQALFLLSIIPFAFGSLIQILESLTLLGVAFGLPYLGDRLILMCIRNIATRVISAWDKAKAFMVLIPVAAMSAYLNIKAPGPDLIRWGCGALVALVPLYQVVRSLRPDFQKAGDDEKEIRKQIADLAVVEEAPVEEKPRSSRAKAKEQQKAKNSERGKKAWETRKRNAEIAAEKARLEAEAAAAAAATRKRPSRAKKAATVADLEAQFALPDAPVSPAVV